MTVSFDVSKRQEINEMYTAC